MTNRTINFVYNVKKENQDALMHNVQFVFQTMKKVIE